MFFISNGKGDIKKFDNIVMSTGATYLGEIRKSFEILKKSKKKIFIVTLRNDIPNTIK